MPVSSERLPWLDDEPAPAASPTATRAAPARIRTGRALLPLYLLLALLIVGVGIGAWWLGTRQRAAPPPELPAEATAPIPVNAPEPLAVDAAPAPGEDDSVAGNAAAPSTTGAAVRPSPRIAREAADVRSGRSVTRNEDRARRPTFPADEPVIAPPPTGPSPIAVYRPNPDRGRVVQLGAFPSRTQAERAWKKVTRRYPYLATKPKMVNTVDVRGLGGGRPTRMYRLQLGTSSQAQSVVICQQLERAGQSCVVVY